MIDNKYQNYRRNESICNLFEKNAGSVDTVTLEKNVTLQGMHLKNRFKDDILCTYSGGHIKRETISQPELWRIFFNGGHNIISIYRVVRHVI